MAGEMARLMGWLCGLRLLMASNLLTMYHVLYVSACVNREFKDDD